MKHFQRSFIEFAIQRHALKFGEFTLKSGRVSPYFFNMGVLNDGVALTRLGQYYADAIMHASFEFDVMFGPAYKGIPIVSASAIALSTQYNRNASFCFNRKEKKTHGEGGSIVGAPLSGRVLIIDDVITAGTAISEAIELIQANNAEIAGVVIAFDRQERGQSQESCIDEIKKKYSIEIASVFNLEQLLEYMQSQAKLTAYIDRINAYRQSYGV